MKNLGIVVALAIFVVLLFVVLGQGKQEKAGKKEVKLEKIDKDAVTRFEVTLPAKKDAAGKGDDKDGAKDDGKPKKVVLEKGASGWTVADGAAPDKKFAAEEGAMKSALDALGEFQMGDLVSNKADKLASYEIDDENGQAVKVFAGDKAVLDVVFGRAAKGGGSTVRLAKSDDVYIAKGRLGTVVKKDVSAWRKRGLVDAKADDITRVSLTLADGNKIVVENKTPPAPEAAPDAGPAPAPKPEWSLVEPASLPEGFRLDKAQLSRPAASVSTLRAQDFADGVSDDTAGLTGAHTVVEATTKDGKKIVVHVGKEDEKKRVYAKLDGDPQMYLLASYTAKQLQKSLDDLRDLSLFDLKPDDVEKVTFQGSSKVVIQRDGEAWRLVEPKAAPADFDIGQAQSVVAGLVRTRAARLAADAPKDALAKAGPVVELALKGGKKQTLRFGAPLPVSEDDAKIDDKKPGDAKKPEPREFYVAGGADNLVYVAPAFTRARFDKPADMFKKPAQPGPGGAGPGGIPGMDKLPPDVRKKLEESVKSGKFPPAGD